MVQGTEDTGEPEKRLRDFKQCIFILFSIFEPKWVKYFLKIKYKQKHIKVNVT